MLTLARPLICFDLETTGIVPATDRIWQIGVLKILPDGSVTEWETLINPGVKIPPEVTELTKGETFPNGVQDNDLVNAPTFKSLAPGLSKSFQGCDLAGYNHRAFDIPLLEAEFRRAGVPTSLSSAKVVDGYKLYMKVKPRNLTAFVEDMTGDKDFAKQAHDALKDARGTWKAILACLDRYPELPRTPELLHDFLFGDEGDSIAGGSFYFLDGEAYINFGKYKAAKTRLRDLPRSYLGWIVDQSDLSPEVKQVCRLALSGKYPERKV